MTGGWDSEQSAAELMQAYLGGVIEVRDPGGGAKQTHDFDVVLGDGRTIATEVTRANVQDHIRDWARIERRSWLCPNLRSLWLVSFNPGLDVEVVHKRLPAVLEQLEAQGIGTLDVREVLSPDSGAPWSVGAEKPTAALSGEAEALRSLRLRRASVIGVGDDGIGEILMNEAAAVGSTSPDVAVRLASQVAHLPDNLAKLRRATDAAERHLFVWVESSRHQAVAAIQGDYLPEMAPDVPDDVDSVWLATAHVPSHVWRWSRSAEWEDLGSWRRDPD